MKECMEFAGRSRSRRERLAVGVLAVCVLLAAGLFVVDVDASTPDPVLFDDTRSIGFASEDSAAIDSVDSVPRAQVFYSQYQYVIGYYGIETAVDAIDDPARQQQFGYPLVTYVTTYDETGIELTNGTIDTVGPPAWERAEHAHYVVDSAAETPAGPVAVPFADRQPAADFADEHGGTVMGWGDLREQSFEVDDAAVVRQQVDTQQADADQRVEDARELLDRPVSRELTPADDLQAELDSAPEGSTVVLEPGTYDGPLDINRSVTLRGHDATVVGDGEGSTVRVNAEDVAIEGLAVEGIGNESRNPEAVTDDEWDANIELGYGHGDAGIAAVDAPGVYLTDLTVPYTEANGILLRDSPDAVVTNVTVQGAADWRDGFMGVMAMRSPAVIQDSAFSDGRDGIYLHRSGETVIRNNAFREGRYGIHLMHTSDSLIADNTFADHEFSGITIMTSPARNAVVDNVVSNSSNGISTAGSHSYIARNIAVDNRVGITTTAVSSLYEHNVVANNTNGMRTGSVLATSTVHSNDFVDNDNHATASAGPLRVWADGRQGNYWQGAYGTDADSPRPYLPTAVVDGQLHRSTVHYTLAESPVNRGLRALQGSTPGLRSGSIIDPYPQPTPQNPDRYAIAERVVADGIDAAPSATNTTTTP